MEYSKYSLLEFLEPNNIIINPVNTVGYMGKGLALEIALRFPETEKYYKQECEKGEFEPGEILFNTEKNIVIGNLATKKHFKYPSKIEWIEKGIQNLKGYIIQNGINNKLIIPKIGSGLGKLSWDNVKIIIEQELGSFEKVVIALDEKIGPKEQKAIMKYKNNENSKRLIQSSNGEEEIKRFRDLLKQKGIGKNKYKKLIDQYF